MGGGRGAGGPLGRQEVPHGQQEAEESIFTFAKKLGFPGGRWWRSVNFNLLPHMSKLCQHLVCRRLESYVAPSSGSDTIRTVEPRCPHLRLKINQD